MKLFYFLLFFMSCFSTSLIAQEEIPRYPQIFEEQCYTKYTKANQIHCKEYNHFEILGEWDKYFDYSEDSLSLKITGNYWEQSVTFSPDKKMLSFSSPINNWYDTYTYNEDGKILRIDSKNENGEPSRYTLYDYTDLNISRDSYMFSKIYNEFIPTDKIIIRSKNADSIEIVEYIYNVENKIWNLNHHSIYKLDPNNRIIETGYIDQKENYILSTKYEYTNNGYIKYTYSAGRNTYINEYTFNENDELIKDVWYYWLENGNKNLINIREYTYIYKNPTASEDILLKNSYKVFSKKSSLIIQKNNINSNKSAYIYSINGQLIKQINLSSQTTEINLSKGLYVVRIEDVSYKIRIR